MTRILDVDAFHSGIEQTQKKLTSQETQVRQLEIAVKEIISLEESFKGEGGEAIRFFYEKHHLPLLSNYSTFVNSYQETLKYMTTSLRSLEPSEAGFIRQDFLEMQVEQGLTKASNTTIQMISETNSTMESISDIVALPKLKDDSFISIVEKAKREKNHTIEQLTVFDHRETSALAALEQQLQTIVKKVSDLQNMFQPADVDIVNASSVNSETCEKPVNTKVENDKNLLEIVGDVFLGVVEGIVNFVKDLIVGLFDLIIAIFTDLPGLLMGIVNAVINYDETIGAMVEAFETAWERDVINGDARSRSRFFTYGILSIVGLKGVDKLGKVGSLGKLGKVSKADTATPAPKIKTDIPYNVMDTSKLKIFMKETLIRQVEKLKNQSLDFVRSNLVKTVINLKNLSAKLADILNKAKNVLNPVKINQILKNTYNAVVKGSLRDTKIFIDKKIKKILDIPLNPSWQTHGPGLKSTIGEELSELANNLSKAIISDHNKQVDRKIKFENQESKHPDVKIEGKYNLDKLGVSFQEDLKMLLSKQDNLSLENFNTLRLKQTDLLNENEIKIIKGIRRSVPALESDTLMQKVLPPDAIKWLFQAPADGTQISLGGYLARANDTKELNSFDKLFEGLRLDYENNPFQAGDNALAVRFKATNPDKFKIPFGGKNTEAVNKLTQGDLSTDFMATEQSSPFTGNGFTESKHYTVPEYRNDQRTSLHEGSELYEITNQGEKLIGIYSAKLRKFIEVNE